MVSQEIIRKFPNLADKLDYTAKNKNFFNYKMATVNFIIRKSYRQRKFKGIDKPKSIILNL